MQLSMHNQPATATTPRPYPQDRDLIVHEITADGREHMVILSTVLQRLSALGRDVQHDRSVMLNGLVVHFNDGQRFMLTARSLYEHDMKRRADKAPRWYEWQLHSFRGRHALHMIERALHPELFAKLDAETAKRETEFHAEGAEKREEVSHAQ